MCAQSNVQSDSVHVQTIVFETLKDCVEDTSTRTNSGVESLFHVCNYSICLWDVGSIILSIKVGV
jgi:hypothetical protein